MNIRALGAVALLLGLAACGGGGSSATTPPAPQQTQEERYWAPVAESNAAADQAAKLAAPGPCSNDNQCSALRLQSPLAPCYFTSHIDYSLASPTAAAASAAAAQSAAKASEAMAIAPPSNSSGTCLTNVDNTPLVCEANKCQRMLRFNGG